MLNTMLNFNDLQKEKQQKTLCEILDRVNRGRLQYSSEDLYQFTNNVENIILHILAGGKLNRDTVLHILERRIKIKLEEHEAVNRYLLNLKKEIGTQIRLLKPNTITEVQTHAIETEMLLKESQPARTQLVPRPVLKYLPRPQPVPRSNANTNGIRTPNHSLPLADRVKYYLL